MTTSDHERFQHDLGVYVLGGLEPGERDSFERHLATCDACRDDLADLAVLPALLSRLPASDDAEAVAPPPVEPVLERIAAERRHARRRNRLLAVAAAVASLAAAVVLVLSAIGPAGPAGPAGQEYLAADRTATATVESRGWGMEVTIHAADLPPRDGYTAYAVRDDGHRAQVASWSSTGRPVELQGSCYLQADDVSHIEIVAARSDEVVSVLEPGPVTP